MAENCGNDSGYSGYGSEGGYALVNGELVANHICSKCGVAFATSEALREHKVLNAKKVVEPAQEG